MDSMTENKIEIMGIHLFVKAVGIKPLASTTRIRVYTIQYWSWESRLRSRVTVQCNKVHYNPPPPPPRERPFYYTTLRATEWVHHHLESDRMSTSTIHMRATEWAHPQSTWERQVENTHMRAQNDNITLRATEWVHHHLESDRMY